MLLFIVLYKVVLTFGSVYKILQTKTIYGTVISCGAYYCAVQDDSNPLDPVNKVMK